MADDYAVTLQRIVESCRALNAAKSVAEAEKAENHTGLNLDNPELGFSYQWGQPGYVPDKKTIDLTQSFNFATLSGAKRNMADARDRVADASTLEARRNAAAEADALMTDIVYRRRLAQHYDSALLLVNNIYSAAEKARKKGNMNIVDVNSIRMEANALLTESKLNLIELNANLASLQRLAAGYKVTWNGDNYLPYSLPENFDSWSNEALLQSSDLILAKANASVADEEIKLRKKENLPNFSAGFTSEIVKDANYYGVALGVELPLWANSGKVKAAQAAKAAAMVEIENTEAEFRQRLQVLYDKAVVLHQLEIDSRKLRDECDIRPGLAKLYSAGQLSVHDYLSQLQPLLELDKKMIEAEHDYQLALTEFRAASR